MKNPGDPEAMGPPAVGRLADAVNDGEAAVAPAGRRVHPPQVFKQLLQLLHRPRLLHVLRKATLRFPDELRALNHDDCARCVL